MGSTQVGRLKGLPLGEKYRDEDLSNGLKALKLFARTDVSFEGSLISAGY